MCHKIALFSLGLNDVLFSLLGWSGKKLWGLETQRVTLSLSFSLSLLSPPLFSALLLLDSRVFPLIKRKLFPSSSLFSHARSCFARNTFPRSLPETERDRRPFSWNQDRFIEGKEEESRRNDLEGNFHFTNDSNRSLMRTRRSRMKKRKDIWRKVYGGERTNKFSIYFFT